MSDRELLELAAKAAGIEIGRCRLDDPMFSDMLLAARDIGGNGIGWNPLTDDGDALRLAVKLGLAIHQNEATTTICVATPNKYGLSPNYFFENIIDDKCYGARRAITRAAAEIGKVRGGE